MKKISLLILSLGFTLNSIASEYHVTKVLIHRPYKGVWNWVSNPMNFKKLYPNWVKEIEKVAKDQYRVVTPTGWKHEMQSILHESKGIIDFQINPGENSRSRLLSIGEQKTLHIHIAIKGEYMNDQIWLALKKSVDSDYKNAKKVIENE